MSRSRKEVIKITKFSTFITLPNGRKIYAKDYGLRAFPIGGGNKKKTTFPVKKK